jgi:hypothetical protein
VLADLRERNSASDRSGGSVERCEEAVACGLDLSSSKASQFVAHGSIVGVEQGSPPLIADCNETFGRGHDVREQDRREDAVDVDHGPVSGQELRDLVS